MVSAHNNTGPVFVSICIPAYNQIHFLRKTLDSINAQTYRNFEVIISDDSTNDDVAGLANEYAGKFDLKYRRNSQPLGPPANWNAALDMASGELIKVMHHDDWFAGQHSLAAMVQPFLDAPETGFLFCASEIRQVTAGKVSVNRADKRFLARLSADPRVLFNNNRIGAPSATMFRKSGLRFDERLQYLVDIDFYVRYLIPNRQFVYLDQPLVVNTADHGGQVTARSMTADVQVREALHLYGKLYAGAFPAWRHAGFFINMFDSYRVKRWDRYSPPGSRRAGHEWYFDLLVVLARLKRIIRRLRKGDRS